MSNDLHESILALITDKGPMGVTQLQRELDIPSSTLQKYLDRQQSYFQKDASRKWDLPERVAGIALTDEDSSHIKVIETQLAGIQASYELLTQQLHTVVTLSNALRPIPTKTPVATNPTKGLHPEIVRTMDDMALILDVFKRNRESLTDEQFKLLMNTDWIKLLITIGRKAFDEDISYPLGDLLGNKGGELDESIINTVKEYQK